MLDENILKVLRTHRDTHVSGEELCKRAGISRAAIWKHMEKLRGEGYEIEASPHLGYRLRAIPDLLIPAEIKWGLNTKRIGAEIISYAKVDSTNDAAYALAEKGIKEGTVVLAEEQGKGKGRHGRSWVSPPKGGVYLSCVLRPSIAPNEIARITLVAAVAVAQALRRLAGIQAMIKWPNDILVGGKKVCGILTEMKAEQDRVDFVVIGIGINVTTSAKALPHGAAAIRDLMPQRSAHLSRISVVQGVLEELERHYVRLQKEGFDPIIEEWKGLSAIIGSRVNVALAHRSIEGVAHNVDPDGSLVVRTDAGVWEKVSSGDVTLLR